MKMDFINKTVIITGGTRGIGLAILKLFKKNNATIIATGTNKEKISKLNKDNKNNKIKYLYLDFTVESSINSFLIQISKLDKIDILVNNAGANKISSIKNIKTEDWDMLNNINLRGPFLITREISKVMELNTYGRIINISSIFGTISKSKRASYSTTKWGLIGFTKAVALDLASKGVLVNAVSPGFVDTSLTREILGEDELKKLISTIPQKRLAEPKEIAKTILFLSSDENTYITGQNIIIDGGYTSA